MEPRNVRRARASAIAREIRRAARKEGRTLSFGDARMEAYNYLYEQQKLEDNPEAVVAPVNEDD